LRKRKTYQIRFSSGNPGEENVPVSISVRRHRSPASGVKAPPERSGFPGSRRIEATDRWIDQLVYELYGLTDEEIRIVESATARG
jgi:hypothetical protein